MNSLDNLMQNDAIRIDTKEKEQILKQAWEKIGKIGRVWKYTDLSWDAHGKNTCYYIKTAQLSSVRYAKRQGDTIFDVISFKEFQDIAFKIGDYITITKSSVNWFPSKDQFDGKTFKITNIITSDDLDLIIKFEEGSSYTWSYNQNHFRKATKEEIKLVMSKRTISIYDFNSQMCVHVPNEEDAKILKTICQALDSIEWVGKSNDLFRKFYGKSTVYYLGKNSSYGDLKVAKLNKRDIYDINEIKEFSAFKEFAKKFHIGSWVTIQKSETSWNSQMDVFIGETVKITEVIISDGDYDIKFEGCETWIWGARDKHFREATKKEIIEVSNIKMKSIRISNFSDSDCVHVPNEEDAEILRTICHLLGDYKLFSKGSGLFRTSYKDDTVYYLGSGLFGNLEIVKDKGGVIYNINDIIEFKELKTYVEIFQVGSWITITKGGQDWSDSMDKHIGETVKITAIQLDNLNYEIQFNDDSSWVWTANYKHFRKATRAEVLNAQILNEQSIKAVVMHTPLGPTESILIKKQLRILKVNKPKRQKLVLSNDESVTILKRPKK